MLIYESTKHKRKRKKTLLWILIGSIVLVLVAVIYASIFYLFPYKKFQEKDLLQTFTGDIHWVDSKGNVYENITLHITLTKWKAQGNKVLLETEARLDRLNLTIKTTGTLDLETEEIYFEDNQLNQNLGKGSLKRIDTKNLLLEFAAKNYTLHNQTTHFTPKN